MNSISLPQKNAVLNVNAECKTMVTVLKPNRCGIFIFVLRGRHCIKYMIKKLVSQKCYELLVFLQPLAQLYGKVYTGINAHWIDCSLSPTIDITWRAHSVTVCSHHIYTYKVGAINSAHPRSWCIAHEMLCQVIRISSIQYTTLQCNYYAPCNATQSDVLYIDSIYMSSRCYLCAA